MGSDWEVEALDERRLSEVLATGDWQAPPTLAELMGLTEELAGTILEGMLEANPRDAAGWVLLARVHRSLRQPLAARFSAEVAARLEPDSPATRLARAEGLLPFESERPAALALLRSLAGTGGPEGERASALLAAIGG